MSNPYREYRGMVYTAGTMAVGADRYGDSTVYRGEQSKDGEIPTLDVQPTMEMWKRAYESKCFELESAELEVKRLRALVEHTYYINDAGNLCQRFMDNLTADMAREILEAK